MFLFTDSYRFTRTDSMEMGAPKKDSGEEKIDSKEVENGKNPE